MTSARGVGDGMVFVALMNEIVEKRPVEPRSTRADFEMRENECVSGESSTTFERAMYTFGTTYRTRIMCVRCPEMHHQPVWGFEELATRVAVRPMIAVIVV